MWERLRLPTQGPSRNSTPHATPHAYIAASTLAEREQPREPATARSPQDWADSAGGPPRPAGAHLHTVVADAAVGAARRPVEAAGGTPLHAHLDALDLHGFVKGRPEVVFFVFILFSCREEKFLRTRLCCSCTRHWGRSDMPSGNAV